MDPIIALVCFIGAVLDITLFFKLWGMTNDVRALKNGHFDNHMPGDVQQLRAYLRNHIILGDKEKARHILTHDFLNIINNKCNYNRSLYLDTMNPVLDTDITPYVDLLRKQLAIVHLDIPEEINRLKTFRDYYEIYKDEYYEIDR